MLINFAHHGHHIIELLIPSTNNRVQIHDKNWNETGTGTNRDPKFKILNI